MRHLEKTAVIRKKQPTNFAQKARISNSMRNDANRRVNEFQKRTEPLINLSLQPSKLNGYNPLTEPDLFDDMTKPVSPYQSIYEKRLSKVSQKTKTEKSKNKITNDENTNTEINSQNRPKPRYSLFKRNDE